MPYKIVKSGSGSRPWKLIKKLTGKIVGSFKTKADAEAGMRARYAHSKEK